MKNETEKLEKQGLGQKLKQLISRLKLKFKTLTQAIKGILRG